MNSELRNISVLISDSNVKSQVEAFLRATGHIHDDEDPIEFFLIEMSNGTWGADISLRKRGETVH